MLNDWASRSVIIRCPVSFSATVKSRRCAGPRGPLGALNAAGCLYRRRSLSIPRDVCFHAASLWCGGQTRASVAAVSMTLILWKAPVVADVDEAERLIKPYYDSGDESAFLPSADLARVSSEL